MSAPHRSPAARPPGTPLYTAAGVRAIEAAAAAQTGDTAALMQRAGQAAWRVVGIHWPHARQLRVVCGPGDNGGDGYVLARLAQAAGLAVRVVRLSAHAPRTALAGAACDAFVQAGGHIDIYRPGALRDADLIVDALYGIGLSRAVEGESAELVEAVVTSGADVLALDVPSGVDSDRGHVAGVAIRATRTLQFLVPYLGLQTDDGPDHAGALLLDALAIDPAFGGTTPPAARRVDVGDLGHWLHPRPRNSHKGRAGRVLCIGGDHGMGGAVLLAAEAALRSGAGLVRVATRAAHIASLLARCPEAMASAVGTDAALADLLTHADVVALGPGLGQGAWGHGLYADVLECGVPLVLDADALNLLASRPRPLPPGTILTPHPGEAARLLACTTAEVQQDRSHAVRMLAERHGAVVVLKGAGTLVCAPGATPWLIAAGNPGMAAGGMGDVLTGVVAALRAQRLAPEAAAVCGALLHAAAGDRAAHTGGERGLRAIDLMAELRPLANPGATP